MPEACAPLAQLAKAGPHLVRWSTVGGMALSTNRSTALPRRERAAAGRRRRRSLGLGLLLFGLHCEASPRPPTKAPPDALAEQTSGRASAVQGALPPESSHGAPALTAAYPATERVVAIGDLHGDEAATRAALRLAGALGPGDTWAGGHLTLVQTGDQLDRGDGERAIVDLFDHLAEEAQAAGGRVVALNGNHETMNVAGDFRYVTPRGLEAFAGSQPKSAQAGRVAEGFRLRAEALLPGGQYARRLARRDVVAQVGDSVFVHGGVLPEHLDYGLDRINRETRAWMLGEAQAPAVILSDRAPVWVRTYSADPVDARECEVLEQVLRRMRAVRMVVGHTTQKRGISSACGGRVFRIDVGLSGYYGSGPIQVLELGPQGTRILTAPR